jgi:hypothetical protein
MGSHQDLLARRGIYYKLFQLQFTDRAVEAAENRSATAEEAAARRTVAR